MIMELEVWKILGISLGMGLLVGLQREWSKAEGAGIRTYPMITVFGTVCGILAERYGGGILFAGILAVGAMMVVVKIMMNVNLPVSKHPHAGLTTGIAALLMFAVGAMLTMDMVVPAVAIGGVVALLLQWKQPLHGFVKRIGKQDIQAIFRLVLIAMVVLPVLPDKDFGPFGVLNPSHIWLMVVFIVGISIGSYLVAKFLGAKTGLLLGGIFGGFISSTATTISYARRSKTASGTSSAVAAMVIMIASTIVFVRVGFEVAVVAPSILPYVLPQLMVMCTSMAVITAAAWFFVKDGLEEESPEVKNPSELGAAVAFGALYAFVLVSVAAANEFFGDQGLYIVAAFSGLTDMNAITLSTSQLVVAGKVGIDTGWRMMMLGAMSNILFKIIIVAVLGNRRLFSRMAVLFGISLAAGAALLLFWPKVG